MTTGPHGALLSVRVQDVLNRVLVLRDDISALGESPGRMGMS